MSERFRISVEALENAYEVEIPDFEAIKQKKADAKKNAKGMGMMDPYTGDCTKTYAAKSVGEVLKLVKGCLEKMPEAEFDSAFSEAAEKHK